MTMTHVNEISELLPCDLLDADGNSISDKVFEFNCRTGWVHVYFEKEGRIQLNETGEDAWIEAKRYKPPLRIESYKGKERPKRAEAVSL